MKLILTTAVAAAIGGTLLAMVPAQAQEYPWCAQYGGGRGGARNCGFVSYRQCMAALWGNGGYCERNLFFRGWRSGQGAPYAEGPYERRWR